MCFFCAEQVLLCPAVFCSSICARVPVYAGGAPPGPSTPGFFWTSSELLNGAQACSFAWELEMSRVSTVAEHDINLIVLGGHPLLLDSGEREEEEEGVPRMGGGLESLQYLC